MEFYKSENFARIYGHFSEDTSTNFHNGSAYDSHFDIKSSSAHSEEPVKDGKFCVEGKVVAHLMGFRPLLELWELLEGGRK